MVKLYRMLWVGCKNLDILNVGPILYHTERNGSPKKLEPWTREEAERFAAVNTNDNAVLEVEEAINHARDTISRGETRELEDEIA